MIGIYLFCAIVEYLFKGGKVDQVRFLFFILVLNAVATLLNPYGLGLHAYIGHYLLNNGAVMAVINEFLSPVFHGELGPILLEMFFALFIIGLAISKMRPTLSDLLIFLAFAHMSLFAQRNMALFVIIVLPIIARLYVHTVFDPYGGSLYEKLKKPWRNLIEKFEKMNQGFSTNEKACSFHLLPKLAVIVLVSIALNGGKVFGFEILHSEFDQNSQPEKTLTIIKERHLDPKHGMAFDNWGGIISYKLGYPVFIDDRADFFDPQFYAEYGALIQTAPGWQNILTKYDIDWILLPVGNRLIEELKTNNQWQIAAQDRASILMVHKSK